MLYHSAEGQVLTQEEGVLILWWLRSPESEGNGLGAAPAPHRLRAIRVDVQLIAIWEGVGQRQSIGPPAAQQYLPKSVVGRLLKCPNLQ